MILIPASHRANGTVIPIVNGFLRTSPHMSLQTELVEEQVKALFVGLDQGKQTIVEREGLVSKLFKDSLKNDDIVEGASMFKKIHTIQKRIRIGNEVVAAGECLGAGGTIGQDEWRNCSSLAGCTGSLG
jgi:hypothetical protein